MLKTISFLVIKYPKIILAVIVILTIIFAVPLADFKISSKIRLHMPDHAVALEEKWDKLLPKIDFYYMLVESPEESVLSLSVLKEQNELLKFIEKFLKENNYSELEIVSFVGFLDKKIKKYSGKNISQIKDQKELNNLLVKIIVDAPEEFKEHFQIFLSSEVGAEEINRLIEAKKVVDIFPLPSPWFFSSFDFKMPETKTSWIWFLKTDKEKNYDNFVMLLRENINTLNFDYIKVHHYSGFFSERAVDARLNKNSIILGIVIALIIGLIIFLFLGGVIYAAASLLIMALAVIWTFGVSALLGIKFTFMHTIVFPLLLGIGVDGAIHLSGRFLEEIDGNEKTEESRHQNKARCGARQKNKKTKEKFSTALQNTYRSTGFSLFLAALTTILAFVSNIVWPGNSYAFWSLGIIVVIGIFLTLLLTYFLWGSVLSLMLKHERQSTKYKVRSTKNFASNPILCTSYFALFTSYFKSFSKKILGFSMSHSRLIIVLLSILTLVSLFFVPFLKTDTQTKEFTPKGTQIYNDFEFLEKQKIENYSSQGILIEGNILNPEVIFALDRLEEQIQDNKFTMRFEGKAKFESANTLFRDLGIKIDEKSKLVYLYDSLLKNENIADSFLELTWKEKAENLIFKDSQRNYHALLAIVWIDPSKGTELVRQAASEFEEDIKKSGLNEIPGIKTYLMGDYFTRAKADAYLRENQFKSFGLAILLTFLVLIPIYWKTTFGHYPGKIRTILGRVDSIRTKFWRTLLLSFIVLVPIVSASLLIVGLMAIFQVPLNCLNVAVIAITIGLGVDYALYLSGRYLEEIKKRDEKKAIERALEGTNLAFWVACLSTVFGFSILSFSFLPIARSFGLLSAFSILLSVLITLFLLPILLVRFVRKGD